MLLSPPTVFIDEGPPPAAAKILEVVVGVAKRPVVFATDIPIPKKSERNTIVLKILSC